MMFICNFDYDDSVYQHGRDFYSTLHFFRRLCQEQLSDFLTKLGWTGVCVAWLQHSKAADDQAVEPEKL